MKTFMNQSALISLMMICGLSFASAKQLGHEAIGYRIDYNGAQAQSLYDALKASGAKSDEGPTTGSLSYAITDVKVVLHMNTNLSENDACFQKPSYSVTFVDTNDNGRKLTMNGKCGDVASNQLGQALSDLGGNEVTACGMGTCDFSASDVAADFDPKVSGDYQYYGQLTVQ